MSNIRPASLAERYRPAEWGDVLGHANEIAYLRVEAARAKRKDSGIAGGRSLLIVGPPGSGKSSLAELYGRAIHCAEPGGDPCGGCSDCLSWRDRTHLNLRLLNGAYGGATFAADVSTDVPSEFDGNGRLVVLIDEAQLLASVGWSVLHDRMERPPANVTFVVCASNIESVPERHRDLFRSISVRELCIADREALLARVCEAEQIAIDEAAIVALARWGGGRARKLLNDLEALAARGRVSEDAVRAHFQDPLTGAALNYLESVLAREPLASQLRVVDEAGLNPRQATELFRGVLGALLGAPALGVDDEHLMLVHQVAATRVDLAVGLLGRGASLRLAPRTMFSRLVQWWAEPIGDRVGLIERMNGFDEFLNGTSAAGLEGPSPLRARRRSSSDLKQLADQGAVRPARRARAPISEGWLNATDVQRVWDAASFLIQKHGLFFNGRVSLCFAARSQPLEVMKAVKDLLNQLGGMNRGRSRAEVGAPFHWVRVHTRDEADALWVHIAFAGPSGAVDRRLERFRRLTREPLKLATKIEKDLSQPRPGAEFDRHLDLLSYILKGIDPAWREGEDDGDRSTRVAVHTAIGVATPEPIGALWGKRRTFVSRYLDGEYRARAAECLPPLSVFDERMISAARSKWEVAEFDYRKRCEEEYEGLVQSFKREWPTADSRLAERRASEWQALEKAWADRRVLRIAGRPGIIRAPDLRA